MISKEQRIQRQNGYFTPNEAAKLLNISTRTFLRLYDEGFIHESSKYGKNNYFSIDSILRLRYVMVAKKFGMSNEHIKQMYSTGITKELYDDVFGNTLLWAQMSQSELDPFCAGKIGRIIDVNTPIVNQYIKEFTPAVGWDAVIEYVHETLLEVYGKGYTVHSFGPQAVIDFNDDGEPVVSRVVIPVPENNAETVLSTANRAFYATWIGSVNGISTPVSVFDEMDKYKEAGRITDKGQKIAIFTQDFASMDNYDPSMFYVYLSLLFP